MQVGANEGVSTLPQMKECGDEKALVVLQTRETQGVSCCTYGLFLGSGKVAVCLAKHSLLELLAVENAAELLAADLAVQSDESEQLHSGGASSASIEQSALSLRSAGVWDCPLPVQQLLTVRGAGSIAGTGPPRATTADQVCENQASTCSRTAQRSSIAEDALLVLLDDARWALLGFALCVPAAADTSGTGVDAAMQRDERQEYSSECCVLKLLCAGRLSAPMAAARTMHRVVACTCTPLLPFRRWRFVFCLFEGELTVLELSVGDTGCFVGKVLHFSHPLALLRGPKKAERPRKGKKGKEVLLASAGASAVDDELNARGILVRDLVALERHGAQTSNDSERLAVLYAYRSNSTPVAPELAAELADEQQATVVLLELVLDCKEGVCGAGEFRREVVPSSHFLVPVVGAYGGVLVCDAHRIVYCSLTGGCLVAEHCKSDLAFDGGAADLAADPDDEHHICGGRFTSYLSLADFPCDTGAVPSLCLQEQLAYVLGDACGQLHLLKVDPAALSRAAQVVEVEEAVGELRSMQRYSESNFYLAGTPVIALCPLRCTRSVDWLVSPENRAEVLGLLSVCRSGARDVYSVKFRWRTDVGGDFFHIAHAVDCELQWLGCEQGGCSAWSVSDVAFSSRIRNGRGELFLVGTDGELCVVSQGVRLSCVASCTQFAESPCVFAVRVPSLHSQEQSKHGRSSMLVLFSYAAAALTQTMLLEDGEIAPCKFASFCCSQRTLAVGLVGQYVVQATTEAVTIVAVGELIGPEPHFVAQYAPTTCNAFASAILCNAVVVSSAQHLCCYTVDAASGIVSLASQVSLAQQLSALHAFEMVVDCKQELFLACVFWFSPELALFRLPGLQRWRRVAMRIPLAPRSSGAPAEECVVVRSLACLERKADKKYLLLGRADGVLCAVDLLALCDHRLCDDGREVIPVGQWVLSFTQTRLVELRWPELHLADSIVLVAAGDLSYIVWLDERGKLRLSATVGCEEICDAVGVENALESVAGLQGSSAAEWQGGVGMQLGVLWTNSGGGLCLGEFQFPSAMFVARIALDRPVMRAVWCGPGPPDVLAVVTSAANHALMPVDVRLSLLSAKAREFVHLGAVFVTRLLYHPDTGEEPSGLLVCTAQSSGECVSKVLIVRIVQVHFSEGEDWRLELVAFKVFDGSIFDVALLPCDTVPGAIRLLAALNSQLVILEAVPAGIPWKTGRPMLLEVVEKLPTELALAHSVLSVGPDFAGSCRVVAGAVFGGIAEYEYCTEECTLRPCGICHGLPSLSSVCCLSRGMSLVAGRDSKLRLLQLTRDLVSATSSRFAGVCELSSYSTRHFFVRLGLGRLGVDGIEECAASESIWGVATNGAVFVAMTVPCFVAEVFHLLGRKLSDSTALHSGAGGGVPFGPQSELRRGEVPRVPEQEDTQHEQPLVALDVCVMPKFLRLSAKARLEIVAQLQSELDTASPLHRISMRELSTFLVDFVTSLCIS